MTRDYKRVTPFEIVRDEVLWIIGGLLADGLLQLFLRGSISLVFYVVPFLPAIYGLAIKTLANLSHYVRIDEEKLATFKFNLLGKELLFAAIPWQKIEEVVIRNKGIPFPRRKYILLFRSEQESF